MNKNYLVIAGAILFFLFFIFLLILGGNSGTKNIVNEQTLTANFGSVNCEVKNEENINYDIKILTNEIEFDSEIKEKFYAKININHNINFNSLGLTFLLKANQKSDFNIALKQNEKILKTFNFSTEKNVINNVNLVLENIVEIKSTDNFEIVIDGNSKFVFDTILIFASEV